MTALDDIMDMTEAADIAGRSVDAMRKAAQRGTLRARRIGGASQRGIWVTTHDELTDYLARSMRWKMRRARPERVGSPRSR